MVTIIIPYFKIAFFKECLDALKNQTCKKFRVFIGDDNSPDDPLPIIEQFSNQLEISYTKFENNLGRKSLTKQWLRCFNDAATADWTMFLGDDDVLYPTCIEKFYESLNEVGESKVFRFATVKLNENTEKISKIYNHPKLESGLIFLDRFLNNNTRSSLSEYIFHAEAVKKIGFKNYPLAWYSDIMAVFQFSENNYICTINNALVGVRISNSSISGQAFYNLKIKAKFQFFYDLLGEERVKESVLNNICEQKMIKSYYDYKYDFIVFLKLTKYFLQNKPLKDYIKFIEGIFRSIKF